ncbi:uncharacterized protein LOC124914878 [Impatiens glandulifera]|uniref:uncharacterized protein LOC124914878 n=1 Tax=Impatiens glandulifera TaxID=253017 RepID=UPI001FB0E6D5|nr:uncharacterized protein LOC124914878 [Impatiens glandulifera]
MVMASICSQLFQIHPTIRVRSAPLTISSKASELPSRRTVSLPSRREGILLLLTGATTLKVLEYPAKARDIPLFGIRKKLEKVEEKVEEVIKEGIETAEEGIVSAEKGIETAEKEIESEVRISGLAQAGAVAVAELFAVVVATSVVNGILGPEAQKS